MRRNHTDFDRTPLRPDRVRRIDGTFAAIPHRFLRHGFWASLEHPELLVYFLLALVADRQGMSFYYDDRLWGILRMPPDRFLAARAALVQKNLLAFDPVGPRYQLLALPDRPVIRAHNQRRTSHASAPAEPTHVRSMIREWLKAHADDDR